ncbi:hypothetical protein E2C01_033359 [Portunus trituberculatus]|uniref:Uncharacterized protein n=1 Tax=Portunus trituberculatus TaxID=210409 RepID=A0A5B7EXN6_PORTR|nr:hypothetical protein [Portunus trituberculatus]
MLGLTGREYCEFVTRPTVASVWVVLVTCPKRIKEAVLREPSAGSAVFCGNQKVFVLCMDFGRQEVRWWTKMLVVKLGKGEFWDCDIPVAASSSITRFPGEMGICFSVFVTVLCGVRVGVWFTDVAALAHVVSDW